MKCLVHSVSLQFGDYSSLFRVRRYCGSREPLVVKCAVGLGFDSD